MSHLVDPTKLVAAGLNLRAGGPTLARGPEREVVASGGGSVGKPREPNLVRGSSSDDHGSLVYGQWTATCEGYLAGYSASLDQGPSYARWKRPARPAKSLR